MKIEFITGSYARTGEKGIAFLEADTKSGIITEKFSDVQAYCPSYVFEHPHLNVLYAVRELTPEGMLLTFRIHENSLELVNELATLGEDPCHISIDETGRFLAVMNYTGGSFSVFRLDDDGIPVEMTAHVEHRGSGPVSSRQASAHPHCGVFRAGKLYVSDLGADRIFIYDVGSDPGKPDLSDGIRLPEGAGPRHLLFPEGFDDIIYVTGELASAVYVFRQTEHGWDLIQSISALPEGCSDENITAAIKQSDDGKAIFVSNRGHDSIAVFRICAGGMLELKCICGSGGRTPRDILAADSIVIAADQDSDHLAVLDYEAETFTLTDKGVRYECIRPTCASIWRK